MASRTEESQLTSLAPPWLPVVAHGGSLRTQFARDTTPALRERLEQVIRSDDLSGFEVLVDARGSCVAVGELEGRVVAIKRYTHARVFFLRTFGRASRAQREAEALAWIHAAGNPVRPLAWASVRRGGCVSRCYVVTTYFAGSFDLRRLRHGSPEEARPLIEDLQGILPARIARLHDAGIWIRTLRGKNVLYRPTDRRVALIDVPRARWLGALEPRHRLVDLATLFVELRHTFSHADLQRFLDAYLREARSLSAAGALEITEERVLRLADRIGHRTRFSSWIKHTRKRARHTRIGQWVTGRRYERSG